MAIVLTSPSITNGVQEQSACALNMLKTFAALTPPVTEANMRANIEAGQPVGFMSDDEWLSLVGTLTALQVEEGSLTAAEKSVINTLRTVVAPPPGNACCTESGDTPASSDGKTSLAAFARTGSATWEHSMELTLDSSYRCDIAYVQVTLTPVGPAPAVTSANPFTCTFRNCTTAGNSVYAYLWVTFAANPTGQDYDINYQFFDANAVSLANYGAVYALNMP